MSFPKINFAVVGTTIQSNLVEFEQYLAKIINESSQVLLTDDDFVRASANVKEYREAEKYLSETANKVVREFDSVYTFMSSVTDLSKQLRSTRLEYGHAIKARKDHIRSNLINTTSKAASDYLQEAGMANGMGLFSKVNNPNWSELIAGRSSITVMRDMLSKALNEYKAQIVGICNLAGSNEKLRDNYTDFPEVFHDWDSLKFNETKVVQDILDNRYLKAKETYEAKIEQERIRIQKEEEAKARAAMEAEVRVETKPVEPEIKPTIEAPVVDLEVNTAGTVADLVSGPTKSQAQLNREMIQPAVDALLRQLRSMDLSQDPNAKMLLNALNSY